MNDGARYVETALTNAAWKAYATEHGLKGDWARARRYGMTRKQLHTLYLRQDGRCYLCGDPLPRNLTKTAIDHDHTCCSEATAYKVSCGLCVRGIACAPCNRLIAAAQDDPDRLRRIADSLESANHRVSRGSRKIFADAPYLDTFLANSEGACLRCQKWESECGCPAA